MTSTVLLMSTMLPLRKPFEGRLPMPMISKQQALAAENARLEVERRRLQDPAYVQQLAKRNYHLVAPGEEAWVVTGTPPPSDAAQAAQEAARNRPWYRRAWQRLTGWLR